MIFIGVMGLFLSACGNESDHAKAMETTPKTASRTFVYECNDGYSFTARIEGEKAWLFLPGSTISLPHVKAASGVKYSDDTALFWSKGNEALLEIDDSKYRCKNNRKQAIWEASKLDGNDFRATGNEPGWHLQIREGNKIEYVGDYGSTLYHFSDASYFTDQKARKTTYQASDGKHKLTLVLEGRLCRDSMSDDTYETTVMLIIDGKTLHGCGKALH